jgi:hypothetical protein
MLCGAEFKGDGLTNLTEEILREPSTQTVAMVIAGCFSQVYSENWEQRAEQKDMKNLPFDQKGSVFKIWAKKDETIRKISASKKK